MSIEQIAKAFTDAVREERAADYKTHWADDIVSVEPGDGPMSRVQGKDALQQKHDWWDANAQVHSFTAEGPFVTGEQFAVHYTMDVTMEGERSQTKEVGIYTVRDGKIAEERFFYGG